MHAPDEAATHVSWALKAADWVVPSMVGAAIYYLRSISSAIRGLSENLAVTVSRLNSHEKRIERLEEDTRTECSGA